MILFLTLVMDPLQPKFFFFSIVKVSANISKIHPKDEEASDVGIDDMTKLSYLHEPGVLHNLATRYRIDKIYVR